MDLRRYKSTVLHIGGHDVDAEITFTSPREEYQSLLTLVKQSGFKTYVSGLLPRGGTNMKPFNETLRELCCENDCTSIDNHDSFMMASSELPFELFLADQVNLKFPSIRTLANNIDSQCPILPKPNQTQLFEVQLLVFFCSSVPVVLFDTPGISRCRSQHVSVESSSLLHHSIYL